MSMVGGHAQLKALSTSGGVPLGSPAFAYPTYLAPGVPPTTCDFSISLSYSNGEVIPETSGEYSVSLEELALGGDLVFSFGNLCGMTPLTWMLRSYDDLSREH